MGSIFRQRGVEVKSIDGTFDDVFAEEELRKQVLGPIGEFDTVDEFRQELDAVRRFVEGSLGHEHGLPEKDIRELTARLHQVLISGSGELNTAQRQLYEIDQDRYTVNWCRIQRFPKRRSS